MSARKLAKSAKSYLRKLGGKMFFEQREDLALEKASITISQFRVFGTQGHFSCQPVGDGVDPLQEAQIRLLEGLASANDELAHQYKGRCQISFAEVDSRVRFGHLA